MDPFARSGNKIEIGNLWAIYASVQLRKGTGDTQRLVLRARITIPATFFALAILALAQQSGPVSELRIAVSDTAGEPISGAEVRIEKAFDNAQTLVTDGSGIVIFHSLPGFEYSIVAAKQDFEASRPLNITLAGPSSKVTITLQPKRHKEQVEVTATADQLESAASGTQVETSVARELPTHPATISDILPLTPGISRNAKAAYK